MDNIKRVLYRLKFHIHNYTFMPQFLRQKMFDIRCSKYIRNLDKEGDEEISAEEGEKFREMIDEFEDQHLSNLPKLTPRRTMLFYSDIIKHSRCNWVTAHRFRRYICKCYHWAIRRGITTFIADYTSPFGLLAMETLISYKNHGADLQLYSARSDYIGKRRSYRLIPETNLEIIYLTMNCDYDYRLPPKVVGNVVFRHVGTVCSEKGIWVSKKWIPGYLIEAWFEP